MSQSNKTFVGEFKLKRGNYSVEGYCPEDYLMSVDTEDVAYVRNSHGEKVGWIPATEKLWDTTKLAPLKNSKKLVKLWGTIVEGNSIEVYYETIPTKEQPPAKVLGDKDFTIESWIHVPIKRGNEITQTKETMLQNLIETNKQAAQQAAYLEAGRLANVTLAGILAKKFPSLPQTPFNALVLANIADQVAKNLKPNPQLAKLTAAMTTQAFLELYSMVDLEGMIHELLSDDSVKAYLGSEE